MSSQGITSPLESVQVAFSRQAETYDATDRANPILISWRERVYAHVAHFMKANSHILELNAGTGIDALYFVAAGHRVHATDVSPGMIHQIERKVGEFSLDGLLTTQLCSFEKLDEVQSSAFDYVFSNFGGLNCSSDLSKITRHLPRLVKPGGYITWVVMPPVCPWELKWIFQGHIRQAVRRFGRKGTPANVEGEVVTTYYHSLRRIRKAFGNQFCVRRVEGLGSVTPPPSAAGFAQSKPGVYGFLEAVERKLRFIPPINRWADHLIVTLQYFPE